MASHYTMKAVMRLTGLGADRLRVWERRYKAVKPSRTATGRRAYGEAEVKRLQLLAQLVRRGHSIGSLAAQDNRELAVLLSRAGAAAGSELGRGDFDELLGAVDRFDSGALRRSLARARYLLSPQQFAFTLVPELMGRVGERIEAGRVTVAQEHAVSDLVRHALRQVYDDLEPLEGGAAGVMVLAAPEGHMHDLGVLLASLLCRFHGFRTHFLGANLPAAALAGAAGTLGAGVAVLGISSLPRESETVGINAYLEELDAGLPKKTALWLGGPGSGGARRRLARRDAFVFGSLEELGQKLESLRGGI